jgi:hypothetical protein
MVFFFTTRNRSMLFVSVNGVGVLWVSVKRSYGAFYTNANMMRQPSTQPQAITWEGTGTQTVTWQSTAQPLAALTSQTQAHMQSTSHAELHFGELKRKEDLDMAAHQWNRRSQLHNRHNADIKRRQNRC